MFKSLVFTVCLLASSVVWAIPVASYNASTSVNYELTDLSSSLTVEASSFVFDTFLDVSGIASATIDGSNNAGPSSDPNFEWSASAMGEVFPPSSMSDSYSLIDGELVISNTTGTQVDASLSFTAQLAVEIFTTNILSDWSLAFASLLIEDDLGTILVDEFLELDSFFEGVGSHSTILPIQHDLQLSLNPDESRTYFLYLDASGTAITQVTEPMTLALLIMGLAGITLVRYRNA